MASGSRVAFAGTAAAGVRFGQRCVRSRPHDVSKKTDDVNENLLHRFFQFEIILKNYVPDV